MFYGLYKGKKLLSIWLNNTREECEFWSVINLPWDKIKIILPEGNITKEAWKIFKGQGYRISKVKIEEIK